MTRIVVLDGYTLNPNDLSWESLKSLGNVSIHDRTDLSQMLERCKEADVILTNKVPLDQETIQSLPTLKFISVLATGFNVVDVNAAKSRDILVSNIPSYSTNSVAQLVFSFILSHTQGVDVHSQSTREGEWVKSKDFCYWKQPIFELAGKNLGILGFGNIGKKVAEIAKSFDLNVLCFTSSNHKSKFVEFVSFEKLLKKSDFLTLHCPLTPQTENIINRESLKLMKPNSMLINTSRGKLINETDLTNALNNQQIAAAALDVLSSEPPKEDNPLLSAKNCAITPHIGWATKEARQRALDITVNNVKSFLTGKPVNLVG